MFEMRDVECANTWQTLSTFIAPSYPFDLSMEIEKCYLSIYVDNNA